MQQAGVAMRSHAQGMLDEGQHTGDQDLVVHGERWLRAGQDLALRGQWMAANPLAPPFLISSPSDLSQGDWGELVRTSQAMLHDPKQARAIDLDALRWNGLAMRDEGRRMAEEGCLLLQETEVMVTRHALTEQAAADLRQAAQTLQEVGRHLAQNGQKKD